MEKKVYFYEAEKVGSSIQRLPTLFSQLKDTDDIQVASKPVICASQHQHYSDEFTVTICYHRRYLVTSSSKMSSIKPESEEG